MLLHSFKLRIAVLVVTVTGSILCLFATASWIHLKRVSHRRVDFQMTTLGHRMLPKLHNPRLWGHLEKGLEFFFTQSKRHGSMMMLAFNQEGEILYQSPGWPGLLDINQFPEPTGEDLDNVTPRQRRTKSHHPDRFRSDRPHRNQRRGNPFISVEPTWQTVRWGGNDWRLATFQAPRVTLVLGKNLDEIQTELRRLRRVANVIFSLVLLSISAAGWFVASRALRPINSLADAAEDMTTARLDQRIHHRGADKEFARLIDVFNAMLARLEKSFQQATRFSADAAHEMKTPLTILQGELEHGLQAAPDGGPEQQRYQHLLDETQRLKTIVRKLLLLSLADAGQLTAHVRPHSISQAVQNLLEDAEVLAPHLTITSQLEPNLSTRADPDLMPHVWNNLLQNATKYNREGGNISFSLAKRDGKAVFQIANTGSEIPEEVRDKIFARFFRADKARSRHVDGTGLGLSLAREIVRAHRGELELISGEEDQIVFQVVLPLSEAGEELSLG